MRILVANVKDTGLLGLLGLLKAAGYLVVLLSVVGCTSLFYHPHKKIYLNPAKFDIEFEEIKVTSPESGSVVHGWRLFSEQQTSKGLVLQLHGNAENMSTHFMSLAWLVHAGYDLVTMDYRGYGKSEGEPSPLGLVSDVKAVVDHLHAGYPKEDLSLVIYGQSLGGVVAAKFVEMHLGQYPSGFIRGLVLEGTFSGYRDAAKAMLWKSWLTVPLVPLVYMVVSDQGSVNSFDMFSAIPVLVIHSEFDTVVPYELGHRLFEDLPVGQKSFLKVAHGDHLQTYFVEDGIYRPKLVEFLDSL